MWEEKMEFEGMNGLQVLWHLLMTDMFIQGIVKKGLYRPPMRIF